jgi:hypothetical protein
MLVLEERHAPFQAQYQEVVFHKQNVCCHVKNGYCDVAAFTRTIIHTLVLHPSWSVGSFTSILGIYLNMYICICMRMPCVCVCVCVCVDVDVDVDVDIYVYV